MGKIYPEGDRYKMNFMVTLDERVSNGFITYVPLNLKLLSNPEVLLESPSEEEIHWIFNIFCEVVCNLKLVVFIGIMLAAAAFQYTF